MKYLKTFVSAIIAGICIGLAGAIFLFLDNKVIGALFYRGTFCYMLVWFLCLICLIFLNFRKDGVDK